LRISGKLRIFPLLKLNAESSPYVDSVIQDLSKSGFNVKIQTFAYEFQKGGNQMLKVSNQSES